MTKIENEREEIEKVIKSYRNRIDELNTEKGYDAALPSNAYKISICGTASFIKAPVTSIIPIIKLI